MDRCIEAKKIIFINSQPTKLNGYDFSEIYVIFINSKTDFVKETLLLTI